MSLTPEELELLQRASTQAAENAYAPYSKFRVGAALLLDDGSTVTGCNVENASYGLTICAERSAIVRAISEKGPQVRVRAVAVDNLNGAASAPCGACRQVLSEFTDDDAILSFPAIFATGERGFENRPFFDLFPYSFKLASSAEPEQVSQTMTVSDVFALAGLSFEGPIPWGTDVSPREPGVYVIATTDSPTAKANVEEVDLPSDCSGRWMPGQPVIYIGRTRKSLRRRLKRLYKHKRGCSGPHRGGQDVLLLEEQCDRWVYWSQTDQPCAAEHHMMEGFLARTKHLPFGNKARPKPCLDKPNSEPA